MTTSFLRDVCFSVVPFFLTIVLVFVLIVIRVIFVFWFFLVVIEVIFAIIIFVFIFLFYVVVVLAVVIIFFLDFEDCPIVRIDFDLIHPIFFFDKDFVDLDSIILFQFSREGGPTSVFFCNTYRFFLGELRISRLDSSIERYKTQGSHDQYKSPNKGENILRLL